MEGCSSNASEPAGSIHWKITGAMATDDVSNASEPAGSIDWKITGAMATDDVYLLLTSKQQDNLIIVMQSYAHTHAH